MFDNLVKSYPEDTFIIYIPPFWHGYYEGIPGNIIKVLQSSIVSLQKQPNVYIFDYATKGNIVDSPCYFVNSDHLNKMGGKAFTENFVEDIMKSGILSRRGEKRR